MQTDTAPLLTRLATVAPFDHLPPEALQKLAAHVSTVQTAPGAYVFCEGDTLPGLYVIDTGGVDIEAAGEATVSRRGPGEVMGERGLFRDGRAMLTARATEPTALILIDKDAFRQAVEDVPALAQWFDRAQPAEAPPDAASTGLTALQVADLMSGDPVMAEADTTITDIAKTMRARGISSVILTRNGALAGIVTARDLTNKVLAEGLTGAIPASQVMSPQPVTIGPDALGLDALLLLAEHKISHLPVSDGSRIVGLIGQTDLFRQQAATASHAVAEIVQADGPEAMAKVMTRLPTLLAQLVAQGTRPDAICRRITDIADAITRRLLTLAEERLGPPPVPYLWLACGSQGRREQTGVSDQDNCLILDDGFDPDKHDAYFEAFARHVSDGLNLCGYVYCPGDMMATNPRWRQPRRVWREYYRKWIDQPDKEAQMLASVMFDLRPIGGEEALYADLRAETLRRAKANSIFVAHMISNSLTHTPPLSLFRGFAVIRSGEHKNQVDLKHNGVVPVVDLGRIYALQGAIEAVNTRARLEAAREAKVVSASGARDLLDAYDLIAETRLRHQAAQIRAGAAPDNFVTPGQMSELERNHLRDAFMVVKTMQSSLGHGRGMLG